MKVLPNPFHVLTPHSSQYLDLIDGSVNTIPESHGERLSEIRSGSNSEACYGDLPLIDAGLIRTEEQLAQETEIARLAVHQYLANSGGLAVMPTERCNFRCTYCYESFEKGRISEELIHSIKQFLVKEIPKFKTYSLGWFGGEPLLQPDIIRDISLVLKQTAERHNVIASMAITTNGYLLDKALPKLADVDIDLLHISVDGSEKIHELQRPRLGGVSYKKILENIELALGNTEAQIIFRINLDAKSRDLCAEVSAWLSEEIHPRFAKYGSRIKFHAVPIWDATSTHVDGICLSEMQSFQNWLIVEKTISKLKHQDLLSHLGQSIAGIGSLACYAGKPNHYVIGSDGRAYKCTVAFDLETNQVGRMHANGILEIDRIKDAFWTQDNALTDPTCGKCAFSLSCMGIHCPLIRMETGKQPCPTQKRFVMEYFNGNA
jgi:uncharacterized protein